MNTNRTKCIYDEFRSMLGSVQEEMADHPEDHEEGGQPPVYTELTV